MNRYDKCRRKGCNSPSDILLGGYVQGLCLYHWEKYCDEQDRRADANYAQYLEHKKMDIIELKIKRSLDIVEMAVHGVPVGYEMSVLSLCPIPEYV